MPIKNQYINKCTCEDILKFNLMFYFAIFIY